MNAKAYAVGTVMSKRERLARERQRVDYDRSGSKWSPESVVYFIRQGSDGPVKIGWSLHPEARMADLQTSTPRKLVMLATIRGGRELEQKIHDYFKDHRIRGEWFDAEPVLKALNSAGFLGKRRV